MTAQARFTQAEVQRAIKAAKKCGFSEVRVRIAMDGSMDIIVGMAANDSNERVELR